MYRTRFAVLGLFVILAIGATASSAAAAEWLVEGSALTKEESVEIYSLGSVTLLVTINGEVVKRLCDQAKTTGTISPGTAGVNAGISFSECKITEPSGCKTTATGKTGKLDISDLVVTGNKLITFKLESGTSVETLEITECALEGEYDITGDVSCEVEAPSELAVTKNCVFKPGVDQGFEIAGKPVTFEGTFSFGLTGIDKGKEWGVE